MDTMTRDIQHDTAQRDPGVDNTHVSTQEIMNRKMSEAPVQQSQAFVLLQRCDRTSDHSFITFF